MFKSFVLGLYASGHSLHVRVTQTFAVNRFRTGAIYSMHSKTTHRLSFLKDDAKVLLFLGTGWESSPNFVPILFLLSILCFSKAILIHRPSEYNRKSAAHDAAVIVRLRIIIVTYQFLLCQPLHYLYIIPFRRYPFSRVYWFGHRLYLLLERA